MASPRPVPPFPLARIALGSGTPPRYYRCPPDWTCDLQLDDFDLWYVFRGRGRLTIDGTPHAVFGPQVFVFQPGQHVRGIHHPDEPLEVTAFHFRPPDRERAAARALAARLCGFCPRHPSQLHEQCAWLVAAGTDPGATEARHVSTIGLAILLQLWRDLHAPAALPSDWRVETLIREICRDPAAAWDVRRMARVAGISSSHIGKRFRAITGRSPRQFVIHRRIQFAEALMTDTRLSLAQVAEATGYRDVFFFSRQFKQLKGVSPAQFRRTQCRALSAT